MFAKVYSAVPRGVEALRVQVEVDARPGLPMLSVVGLPDPAVREARERVLAAIRHLGCQLDTKSIVVNLSPAEERKEGALLDLAIAAGVLIAAGLVPGGTPEPWLLGLAIGTWVGGFDVLYACQDLEFDRAQGLRSIPVRYGVPAALVISRLMHVITIVCLMALSLVTPLGPVYLVGVSIVAILLAYEQSLVSADDLSQVKRAFDLNGYVGILYLIVLVVSIYG
jgi:hypothetical protein